jgi:hypothetical protein
VVVSTFGPSRPPFFFNVSRRLFSSIDPTSYLQGHDAERIFQVPRTRRIDWWLIGLLLVSLLSFLGAAILGIIPVL